ncbi:membrane metalloprotease [Flavobacterium sp. L1I52]|uniref:Membrane metalloprotease n=1 Tax=Flavobacterium pokkalii TaxID=1940408 RepID=A0ABR7UQR9_9FLAO|nr:membrane metalloprotease [Flavobacterium pokkalii]MBD0725049.1 membrane metalloprotease [Flavobacterium pokkalii]
MKKILAVIALSCLFLTSCSDSNSDTNSKSANQKGLGTSAHDLLSEDKFDSMIIEVVYVEGYEPSATAITNFKNFLTSRINKSGGITIEKRAIPSPGNASYSDAQIIAIENANRIFYNDGSQIAVWAFFADAKSSKDTDTSVILGTAYRNTSFVIYENTVKKLSGGLNKPSTTVLETTVMSHEFGHILGLTNAGTVMQSDHEDANHKRHCNVSSCLMYWEAESGTNLFGGNIPQLDAQCIADLQANGGK